MKKRSGLFVWGIVLSSLGLLLFGAYLLISNVSAPRTNVTIGGTVVKARLATTDEQRQKGLGGVESLNDGDGMLFVFDDDGAHEIWMKDMKIDIDVVWMNADKKVVYIVRDMKAGSYPKTYGSPKPARYVLELPAGTAARSQVMIGTTASFDLP